MNDSTFHAVSAAMEAARRQLASRNVQGRVVVELGHDAWNAFRMSPEIFSTAIYLRSGPVHECELMGGIVRLKREQAG